ncbi:hypothetical protein C8Q73DRAFT_668968 [Cubamyces lactineus]|nr:hypothetical protein C8Q73DRAFT_668968 [Cubamyces lactineus]
MDSLVSASHQQHQQHQHQQQLLQQQQQQQHSAVAGYNAPNQFSMQVDAHAHPHAFPPPSSSSSSSSSSTSSSLSSASASASAFSASSSGSSTSSHFPQSQSQSQKMAGSGSGYEYEYEYGYGSQQQQYHPNPHQRHPHPHPHPHQPQHQHQHQQTAHGHGHAHGSSPGPSLQIQTATPAPHEHEPEEQTAHPSRPGSGPASFAEQMDGSLARPQHCAARDQRAQQGQSHSHSHDQSQGQGQQGQQQGQSIADALTDNPGPYGGLSRALTLQERELLAHLDRLKFFLATAPSRWNAQDPAMLASVGAGAGVGGMGMGSVGMGMGVNALGLPHPHMNLNASLNANASPHTAPAGHPHSAHPALNRFLLPNQEYVSCVLWGGLYHITGTDIVRALVFRFEAFGRPVRNMKKFEEGVFSDLRNLKPGVDACLEEPKSPFLDLLFKYQCIRTQKKQKVFYWFSVPHDRLFLDALERDLKREKMGLEPTTVVVGEPALSFTYDPKRSLYEQFSKAHGTREGEGELEAAVRRATDDASASASGSGSGGDAEDSDEGRARSVAASEGEHSASSDADDADDSSSAAGKEKSGGKKKKPSALNGPHSPFFPMFSLFEGSPTYKQRRKKVPKGRKSPPAGGASGAEMSSAAAIHPGAFGYDGGEFPGVNGGAGGSSGSGGAYAALGGAYREPQLDRFGRDTMRLSASDMFATGARAEFGANPDLVVSQKERQRRAMDEFAAAAVQGAVQGKLPFLSGLTGPGVAGSNSAASSSQSGGYDMDMVYGLSSAGDFAAGQQQQQPQQYGQSQRPHLEQRHTFPIVDFTHPSPHSRALTDPYGLPASVGQPITTGWVPPNAGPSGSSSSSSGLTAGVDLDLEMDMGLGSVGMGMGTGMGTLGDAGPRTKVFVCPLFSCGRMFKRMEHLRRHLRTHTLERPFPCDRCPKRFSRSDNLAQHVRTHERREAAAAAAAEMNSAMGMNVGMGMAVGVPDGADADAEDELEDDIEGYLPGVGGITSVQMCEVEVRGQVHEVQGDEEGLLTTTGAVSLTGAATSSTSAPDAVAERSQAQSIFYDNSGHMLRASPETSPYLTATSQQQHSPDSQWATIPSSLPHHSSPGPASAFSTASGLHLSHAARLDASYHTTGGLGEYVTSISAPSHKLTFDHATLYPSELPLGAGGSTTSGAPISSAGLGPIRRHRSATPSIPRYGESIRRPFSAALSDSSNGNGNGGHAHGSSPGQGAAPASAASARSYHPYAVPGHHQPASSRSAQSSPMAYTVPLGYEGAPARIHGHSRSSSNGNPSGQLQEQMRQMLSLDQMEAESMAAAQYASAVYRTDSPMSYSDMAHHQQSAYGLAEAQYAAQQQSSSEYFAQPHPHHSL